MTKTAKTSANDIARLRSLLPPLEKALRHGLTTVAYHEADMRKLLADLSHFYDRVLAGQKLETKTVEEVVREFATPEPEASAAPDALPAAAPATQSPVEEIVLDGGLVEAEEEPPVGDDDEHVRMVKSIKPGVWIEFLDDNGQPERAKLSWISPISGKYLFVNRRGLKVCDKTIAAFAAELREGTTTILEEVPLFDRALDAIVAKLRHAAADAPPATDAASPAPDAPVA